MGISIYVKSFSVISMLFTSVCLGQITIPEGTKVRVRLEETITSATAEEGQSVELTVTDVVKVGDQVVIAEGARVTGTITEGRKKRRMGRAGKLDFSIDRVRSIDDQWIPVRYTITKKSGESHAVRNGILTAGVAAVFWPAAPVILLMHGKDITVNKGVSFDLYTANNHTISRGSPSTGRNLGTTGSPAAPTVLSVAQPAAASGAPDGTATVTVTCSVAGADIEVDGAFMGNAPTTLSLQSGKHRITVKSGSQVWQRDLQVTTGSTISVNAVFARPT